jgi:hypothetical protein
MMNSWDRLHSEIGGSLSLAGLVHASPSQPGQPGLPGPTPKSTQKNNFVILSPAKHLSFKAAKIRNEATLHSA